MKFVQRLRQIENQDSRSGGSLSAPITLRVLLVIHNPLIRSENGRKLNQVLNWNDPDRLSNQYRQDVAYASYGYLNYEIVERIEVDGFPVKEDGFTYDAESYLFRWRTGTGFHHPDRVDYYRLLTEFNIVSRINLGQIDEVWLFAFPYAGYYESVMAGPGAFWCNAPPLDARIGRCHRRFVIMGFSYERGVGEMLENLGHRAEAIMSRVYRRARSNSNLWKRFIRHDRSHPGKAECGNLHYAPNSDRDYDWGNRRKVVSYCDDWYDFPRLQRRERRVNCQEWGNGDIRLHHLWWFRHLPHVEGKTGPAANNWWQYISDPNLVD